MLDNKIVFLNKDNIEKHIDAMIDIENISFSQPWSREAYLGEALNNNMAHYVGYVDEDRFLGYGGFWLIFDEGHISNIAVHPDYRGQGIGRQVVTALAFLCIALAGKRMTLEVRVSNTFAIHLYEEIGFKSVGKRKGFYTDNNEDAYIMWLDLNDLKEK